jgi:hypothetical protein
MRLNSLTLCQNRTNDLPKQNCWCDALLLQGHPCTILLTTSHLVVQGRTTREPKVSLHSPYYTAYWFFLMALRFNNKKNWRTSLNLSRVDPLCTIGRKKLVGKNENYSCELLGKNDYSKLKHTLQIWLFLTHTIMLWWIFQKTYKITPTCSLLPS